MNEGFARLTRGERVVLRYLSLGLSVTEIAQERVVSVNTVRCQVKGVLEKLHVNTQLKAVVAVHELELERARKLIYDEEAGYGTEPWLARLRSIIGPDESVAGGLDGGGHVERVVEVGAGIDHEHDLRTG